MIKRYCISIGITALLYFLVAKLIFSSLQLGIEPSPLWPPAGIAMFVVLQQGRQVCPGVALGILLVGHWLGVSWPLAAGAAIGGTIEAILGATLLRRVQFHNSMEQLQDVLHFIAFAGLTAPLLNATISTGTGLLANRLVWQQAGSIWWTIWLGDSMGILVFTPLLLVLHNHRLRLQNLKLANVFKDPQLLEKVLCFSSLISLSWAVFHFRPNPVVVNYPIEYLPFPFVIWASLRLGQTAGIIASTILSVIAISGTVVGRGPFATMTSAPNQVILLQQAFLGVITMTALIVAAMTSERRRVETLLRRSQASLAKAQHLARLGNWDFNFEQQQWSWSDELYRLLGLPIHSTVPSHYTFLQAVHPVDRPRVEQAIAAVLEHKLPYRMNYRLLLPDGTERIVEEQIVISSTNATGTVLDITEHKQNEEKLRLSAERNRLLSETALRIRQSLNLDDILNATVHEVRQLLQADRVFICRFDAEGNGLVIAESVLPEWTSALGWTSDASVYPEIQAMFADEPICVVNDTSKVERTPFIRKYHDLYQVQAGIGVAIFSQPSCSDPPNGERVDLETKTVANQLTLFGLLIVHQCSQPRQWQAVEIDLIEQLGTQVSIAIQQGQLYQQVQLLNSNLEQQVAERTMQLESNLAKLEEMNQLQDVFLHAIAHDLRTSIMGTLMILRNFQQNPGDQISIPRSMLERMTESGEIQLCKLNSLLEAYTNKTEGATLHLEPVDMASLVQTATADLKPLFDQNHTVLEFQDLEGLPTIAADPKQLERVFKHLLVNAVKHNPPRLHVIIRAQQIEDHELRFTIEDNGRGISEAQYDRLFDLKIGVGHDRQRTGIGVGLCLCQQIVAAHGGKIGVESAVGEGSRFWFTLPLHPA